MTLLELIKSRAGAQPTAAAIGAPGRPSLDYRGLEREIDAVGEALRGVGVSRRDRVVQVMTQSAETAVSFLGIAGAAACAPLNPAYRAAEIEFACVDSRARAIVVDARSEAGAAGDVARKLGLAIVVVSPRAGGPAGALAIDVASRGSSGPLAAATGGAAASPEDIALLVHTSGTTARPKKVPLSHANLCAAGTVNQASLALTPSDRCLNMMPLFHLHAIGAGLMTTLASGGLCICTPPFSGADVLDWMESSAPTWYTAAPALHRAVLDAVRDRRSAPRAPLRFIRSSSAALPPTWADELERVFGVPVLQAYAMTETTYLICANPAPPGARKPGSVGLPAIDVDVRGEDGRCLPSGATGEIVVRGASVFGAYEDNPDENRSAFVDGWFRTGDLGYRDADGYYFLTGRAKELINRGGEKISPYEVESQLLRHSDVEQAAVFPVAHASLGESVAAAVVPRPDRAVDPAALRAFVSQQLADHKVPDRIVVVREIPKGPTGKVQRNALAAQLADALGRESLPPRTDLERSVAAIWEDVLGEGGVGLGDNFYGRGGNSLQATRVMARVRQVFGVALSLADFLRLETLADHVALLHKKERAPGATDRAAAGYLRTRGTGARTAAHERRD